MSLRRNPVFTDIAFEAVRTVANIGRYVVGFTMTAFACLCYRIIQVTLENSDRPPDTGVVKQAIQFHDLFDCIERTS